MPSKIIKYMANEDHYLLKQFSEGIPEQYRDLVLFLMREMYDAGFREGDKNREGVYLP